MADVWGCVFILDGTDQPKFFEESDFSFLTHNNIKVVPGVYFTDGGTYPAIIKPTPAQYALLLIRYDVRKSDGWILKGMKNDTC